MKCAATSWAIVLFLATTASGCGRDSRLHYFETTAPDLGYLSQFTGRLARRENCIVMVLGPEMLSRAKTVPESDAVAIPLFNEGFTVADGQQGFSVTTPEGLKLREGDIVKGEGGPFPVKPYDPRSAPVPDPPNTEPCRGILYQVNSLYLSGLEPIYH